MIDFDTWWNSADADGFRAKHDEDGNSFRVIWDAARNSASPDVGALVEPADDMDDLVTMVRRLVRCLYKAAPDEPLVDLAVDYLQRKGFNKGPLRSACDFDALTQSQAARVPDANMFWNNDDSERCYGSIDEFLNEEICNGSPIEVGAVFTIQQARRLDNLRIKVTSINEEECEAEYEVLPAAPGKGGAA